MTERETWRLSGTSWHLRDLSVTRCLDSWTVSTPRSCYHSALGAEEGKLMAEQLDAMADNAAVDLVRGDRVKRTMPMLTHEQAKARAEIDSAASQLSDIAAALGSTAVVCDALAVDMARDLIGAAEMLLRDYADRELRIA